MNKQVFNQSINRGLYSTGLLPNGYVIGRLKSSNMAKCCGFNLPLALHLNKIPVSAKPSNKKCFD